MDIFGSTLSTLRHKDINQLQEQEQETLAKEFSSMMWHEVLKSLEKCDDVLSSEFSKGTHDQLTSLRYQMLSHKMGEQYPLDFSSVFKKGEQDAVCDSLEKSLEQRRFTQHEVKIADHTFKENLLDQRAQEIEKPAQLSQYSSSKGLDNKIDAIKYASDSSLSDVKAQGLKKVNSFEKTTKSLDLAQKREEIFQSPQDFVEKIYPMIQELNPHEKNIPSLAVLAQAALETGWGQKILGHDQQDQAPSFNLFNIKAHSEQWQGSKIVKNALEVIEGSVQKVKSSFRSYESFQDSIKDYFQFIQQGRYEKISSHEQTPESFSTQIAQAGYATDSQYAEKIHGLIDRLKNYMHHGGKL